MKKRTQPITEQTLNEVYGLLPAKGLTPDVAPAEFAKKHGLETRELEGLTESQGLALLDWLGAIPDDQPVEPAGASEANAAQARADQAVADIKAAMAALGYPNDDSDFLPDFVCWELDLPEGMNVEAPYGEERRAEIRNLLLDTVAGLNVGVTAGEGAPAEEPEASGNGRAKDEIRKAEGSLWIKRPLTAEEHQGSLDDLYELESRRTSLEFELDGHKAKVKACQKEIESIDTETYRIIRDIKANKIEEEVPALRVTNHTTGMILWYHRDTGEVLRERAIATGEQLPLDLSGEPDQSKPGQAEAAQSEGPTPDEGQPETEGAPADGQAADDDAEPPLAAGPAADEFGPLPAEDVMPF